MEVNRMNTKKFLVLGVLTLLLLGSASALSKAEIRINSVTWDPTYVEAGDDATIYAKFVLRPVEGAFGVENPDNIAIGQDPSVFYRAQLEPADDLAERYVVIKQEAKDVGHLFVGESWTTPFEVKIRENAVAASYKMRFSVLKTDINGQNEEVVKFMEFDLPIKGSVKFDVDSDNVVNLGSISDIKVEVSNVGNGAARQVMAALSMTTPFTTARTSEIYLGDFTGGESKNATFSVSVDSSADAMVYKIPLTITYLDDNGTEKTESRDIGVRIDETPELKVSLVSADKFAAGKTGKFTVTVVNDGFVNAKFLNIKILEGDGYKILSQDDIYIGNLDSDDSQEEEFEIKVVDGTNAGALPVNFVLTYKSANKNEEITREKVVNLQVLSEADYANGQATQDPFGMILGIVILVPVLVILYISIWVVFKLIGVVTTSLNKRFFGKR
jgi:hypothetical protein